MNRTLTVLTAAVLLAGCSDSSDTPTRGPTSPSTSTAAPEHLGGTIDDLAAGTYRASFLTDSGHASSDALLEVPAGFLDGDDWYVVSADSDTFLGLWVVGKVDRDACLDDERDAVDPGPSVQDLVSALVAQGSTDAPAPEQVTLDGHEASYVELTGPRDLTRCDDNPALWRAPERPIYVDGQVDRVWVLEAEGERLVVDASYARTSTAQEREALDAMVESLRIVPAQTT
jgi:hypothetical protein